MNRSSPRPGVTTADAPWRFPKPLLDLQPVSEAARGRSCAGFATLEWLLVIAAAGGFAAVMSVAFGALIDDASRTAEGPETDLIEAEIAAARISSSAAEVQVSLALSADEPAQSIRAQAQLDELQQQCDRLADSYPDIVRESEWVWIDTGIELPSRTDVVADTQPTAPMTETSITVPPTTGTSRPATVPDSSSEQPTVTAGRWACRTEPHQR